MHGVVDAVRKRAAVVTGLLAVAAAALVLLPLGAAPRDDGAAAPAPIAPVPARRPAAGEARPAVPADPGSIRGVVVDGEGAPIATAEVVAARDGDAAPTRGVSGTDGRFLLAGLEPGGDYLVGARAPGLAPVMAGGIRPGGPEVRLVLRPGVLLRGTVRDGAGLPCAGALVRAVIRYPGVEKEIPGLEVRADEKGEYRFVGVPAVPGEVHAAWKGRHSEPRPLSPVPGSREWAVDLVVETGPGIAGVVRDAAGRPLAGIQVSANPDDGKNATFAETEADGSFELPGLRPLPHRVRIWDLEGRWKEVGFDGVMPPRTGLEATLVPDPEAPGTVAYRVVDAAGRPVPAVRFVEYRAGETRPSGSGSDAPDADGVFRSAQVQQGRWRWIVRSEGGVAATEEFEVAGGRATDLGTLRLGPAAEVRGRILDDEGRPLRDARILSGDDPLPERGMPDADGRFVLRGLLPPEGTVRVLHPRFDPLELPWRCAPGAAADLGDARLHPARGAIRGTVRRKSGPLGPGAVVRISRAGALGAAALDREAPVGEDGRFVLTAVPAGAWSTGALVPDPVREGFSRGRAGPGVDLREGEEREIEIVLE